MFRKWRARLRFGPIWRPRVMTVRWTWTKQLCLTSNDKVRQRKSRSQKVDLLFLCRSPNTGINFRFPSLWLPLNVFKKDWRRFGQRLFPISGYYATFDCELIWTIPYPPSPPKSFRLLTFTISFLPNSLYCLWGFVRSVVSLSVSCRPIRKFSWLLPIIS